MILTRQPLGQRTAGQRGALERQAGLPSTHSSGEELVVKAGRCGRGW